MNNRRNTVLGLVAVGVLLVVVRNVPDVSDVVALAMSLGGALLVVAGFLMLWRTSRATQARAAGARSGSRRAAPHSRASDRGVASFARHPKGDLRPRT